MPKQLCVICQKIHKISNRDYKYLDRNGTYVCSIPCMLTWIKDRKHNFVIHRDVDSKCVTVNNNATEFKSVFESSLAYFFTEQNMPFLYEAITFSWGSKVYTPDFFFPEYGCFIEAKGLWHTSNRSKYKNFRETFQQIPLLVAHWLLAREIPKKDFIIK